MGQKKYLVTGGTGFLGSALVRRLVDEGHQVRVFDNDSRGSKSRLDDIADQIEFVQGDIRDYEAVNKAVLGMNAVCHLAFINGTEFFYEKPELVLEVGVKGMLNVLDGCVEHGVRELILASSSEVYQIPETVPTNEQASLSIPDPLNPRYSYAGGKIISELLSINYGRKYFDRCVIFRPHNVYGPQMGWEHVIPQFALRMVELTKANPEGKIDFPIQGSGEETRSFVYIDDFTDGLMAMINKGEHLNIYHIGTTEEVSILHLVEMVGKYFKRELNIVKGELTQGSTPRRCPDITKIAGLGYTPEISLKDGLKKTIDWYIEHFNERPSG